MLKELGELVKNERLKHKRFKARTALAREVGTSAEHLRRIENGEARPSQKLLRKILDHTLEAKQVILARAWFLLAKCQVDPELWQFVVHPTPVDTHKATGAVVEWLDTYYALELSDADKKTLRKLIEDNLT